jgi:hydrogenase maturation protein HypF
LTYHFHIKGRVQGVGFRPHVHQCATRQNIPGYVSNEPDGVHVLFNAATIEEAHAFTEVIIQQAPSIAIIRKSSLTEVKPQSFSEFSIVQQQSNANSDLLIAPDFALCPNCRLEFHDPSNRRYLYPFITCTVCGPRFSIISTLPYDRERTSMKAFTPCDSCNKEYASINDRRYYSQTNSCADCGIQLTWQQAGSANTISDQQVILQELIKALAEEKIVAVKGIGGFLLLCDASNKQVIQKLRERKQRPSKPFAVLFPDMEMVAQYAFTDTMAKQQLLNEVSPIVLLPATETGYHKLDMKGIAPGLSAIGIMLPYAPLLEWIMDAWKSPLVATSGNLSGSCIVFESEMKSKLVQFADYILDHNRTILIPQDDSVIKFSQKTHQQIILRRARGLAPAIRVAEGLTSPSTIIATGAALKSAFAIQHEQVYVSQYLGNLESYEAQKNYEHTFQHMQKLIGVSPEVVLADLHPDYPSTHMAIKIAADYQVPYKKIQHHEAHFAAVLAEHNLFETNEKILGVVWDGTGYGSDGNIWGGEFFIYENRSIKRIHYLQPFINIAGDKTAKEPRLSALAISHKLEKAPILLKPKFTAKEWLFYQKVLQQNHLLNSSAGRYFDGVAALLNLLNVNSYEGEGGLLLETLANEYLQETNFTIAESYATEEISHTSIAMSGIVEHIINDFIRRRPVKEIAAIFHKTLSDIINKVVINSDVGRIAFSGGVFQNAVLVDLINLQLGKTHKVYFHEQLPPNDECIAFGQLMHFQNIKTT